MSLVSGLLSVFSGHGFLVSSCLWSRVLYLLIFVVSSFPFFLLSGVSDVLSFHVSDLGFAVFSFVWPRVFLYHACVRSSQRTRASFSRSTSFRRHQTVAYVECCRMFWNLFYNVLEFFLECPERLRCRESGVPRVRAVLPADARLLVALRRRPPPVDSCTNILECSGTCSRIFWNVRV